ARLAAVWVKDDVQAVSKVNLSAPEFAAENDLAHQPGRYAIPAWFAAYGTAANPLYAGVWQKNAVVTGWNTRAGAGPAEIDRLTDAFALERLRPGLVTPGPGGRYTGLWVDGTLGEQLEFHDLTGAEYQAKLNLLRLQGFLPVRVQATGTEPGSVF